MFTRIVGLLGFIFFGFMGIASAVCISSSPTPWWTFLCAVLCLFYSSVGLFLLIKGDAEEVGCGCEKD